MTKVQRGSYASGIYVITNLVNGNRYIGSTKCFSKRWYEHRTCLVQSTHPNRHLQSAYAKYGVDAFTYSVLEYVEDERNLICREQYYIDTLKPAYNIRSEASSNRGLSPTPETRAKLSAALKGKVNTPENIERIRNLYKGKNLSEEHRTKIGMAHKGKTLSLEHRIKLGLKSKGHTLSPEARAKISAKRSGPRQPLSEEHRAKIGAAHRGGKRPSWHFSEEWRAKRSALMKKRDISYLTEAAAKATRGKPLSEQHKAKLSAASRGKVITQETRDKIAASLRGHVPVNKGKKLSDEERARLKKVRSTPEYRAKLSESAKRRHIGKQPPS